MSRGKSGDKDKEYTKWNEPLLARCLEELSIQGAPLIAIRTIRIMVEDGLIVPIRYYDSELGGAQYGFRLVNPKQ